MAKDLFFIPLGGGGGGGDMSNYYTKQQIDAMLQGVQSIQGFQGTAGENGTQGTQGIKGSDGTNGVDGLQGIQGAAGASIQGSQGIQGIKGADGTNGVQGIQGAVGASIQGLQGEQGIQGASGASIQGSQGIQGTAGTNGVDGSQGIQGIKGTDGTNGIQGIQGIRGDDGKNGADGLQGIQGIQGASGGGVETVELTELTESELGELYEIVVNSNPVSPDTYLAEHRLVANGMPVTSWGDAAYTINASNELVEDDEGEIGAAFYTDTRIEKYVGEEDTISAHWYCIFAQEDGGNYTYVLDDGINTYENSGGGASRYDISTKSQAELAEFYQNWQTIMASNDVYFGVYPVISVNPAYTQMDVGGVTVDVMLVEYNLQLGYVNDMPNIVSGKAGAWYILPNGMGGDYTAEMLFASKTYVDNGLQGKQDTLTAGEGISIQGTTISATGGGGGGNAWYGTQAEFDALQSPSADVDYFISDQIKWDEIKGRPDIGSLATKSELNKEVIALDELVGKKENKIQYMSMQGFQSIQPQEGYVYAIEGSTVEMVFTFTDSTQATYNVVID